MLALKYGVVWYSHLTLNQVEFYIKGQLSVVCNLGDVLYRWRFAFWFFDIEIVEDEMGLK